MIGYVDEIDWVNAESMRYWSFPASYSLEKRKTEVNSAIFSEEYYGALKVDGYYQRLVKDEDGNCFMIARSKGVNGPINKYEWVPQLHPFMESLPNGTVLLSECYLPNNEGSSKITRLLGCLKDKCIERQKKGQFLHFYIFDICAWDGENLINIPALERFNKLEEISKKYRNDYIEWAKYYCGKDLWENLQNYLVSGREGMVITHKDCPIYFKRTPAHKTIKIKKELKETLDVVIIGANKPTKEYSGKDIDNWIYWENSRTGEKLNGKLYNDYFNGAPIEPVTKTYWNGWAGSLRIGAVKNGALVEIGSLSGVTEEVLSNWKDYIGKVAEITAMQIMDTDNRGLRHPKFIKWREDLSIEDASYYKIFGGDR